MIVLLFTLIMICNSHVIAMGEKPVKTSKEKSAVKEPVLKQTLNQSNSDITVIVKGMVCSFCAQGISKRFDRITVVKKVEVSLDDMSLYIMLHDNTSLSDSEINRMITEVGYDIDSILRKNF